MPDMSAKLKKGRPRASEPRAQLSASIRVSDYDSLIKLARLHEKSIAAVVRELLHLRLPR